MVTLSTLLRKQKKASVIPFDPDSEPVVKFDFSDNNSELDALDPADTEMFTRWLFGKLEKAGSRIGIGGYGENRTIYRHSSLFSEGAVRSFHLGIDLWVKAGTPVMVPYPALVHSCRNNKGIGDYGPTLILEHTLESIRFYTLYGHLSGDSIETKKAGDFLEAGCRLGSVGESFENGNWPPHLHFEVISDLQGRQGDFPGVCAFEEKERYLAICPDPNLILKLKVLGWPPFRGE
jgi:peptidoglycan LD-endopeptidase LytH